jgi:predicted nicotinamide N-methyase
MSTKAQSRWRLLRSVLLNQPLPEVDSNSKLAHPGFGLFKQTIHEITDTDYQVEYILPEGSSVQDVVLQVRLLKPQKFNLAKYKQHEFTGFLNTGLMNVWEASHVLAHVLKFNSKLSNAIILELGGGMAAVSSLILSKYHTRSRFIATDGNPDCVANIQRNIQGKPVVAQHLIWGTQTIANKADVIIVADCTYDDAFHRNLLDSIEQNLSPRGTAFLVAPNRGGSLQRFTSLVQSDSIFSAHLQERYDEQVWNAHLENSKLPHYSTDDHYPLLLQLTFRDQESSKQTVHTLV